MAVNKLGTAELYEFDEYQDVSIRVASTRGSTPIFIVEDGKMADPYVIGRKIQDLFEYLLQSEVFNTAKEKQHDVSSDVPVQE